MESFMKWTEFTKEQIDMATETLPIKKTDSIFGEIDKMRDRVMKRAYEIFDGKGQFFGGDLDNWLQAEHELLFEPSIELSEKDNEFFVNVAVPGMEPKDLEIEVTAEDLLVKGKTRHEHQENKGKVHTCEFQSGSLFRTIHFPKKVNPDKVKAEFKNGMLHFKAPIAEEQHAKKVMIEAA
jgi:HSP20 family molecular chaperone IbpA